MSWIQKLYRTYNEAEKNSNLSDLDKLAPLWHSPQTAHIEIILDQNGNFISAQVLRDKPIIMLPVTETSEGRTSGLAPHALADSLQYIAKDLGLTHIAEITKELEDKNGKKKIVKEKKEELIFNLYAKQLDEWCACTDNPKILAIQKYVHKGTVLSDLIKSQVVPVDNNGNILEKWNKSDNITQCKPALLEVLGQNAEIRKALVVWSVTIPNDLCPQTWKDKNVQKSWGEYYQTTLTSQFCSVLGEEQQTRDSHPAKLIYSGDKAKLISSNDTSGFTYLGRFENANQAASISAEVSHKAHAALRWLIERGQGIRNENQVTVAWALSGKEIPSPMEDSHFYLDDDIDISASNEEDIVSATPISTKDWSVNLGAKAAEILKKKLRGYQAKLEQYDQITLLIVDGTTPGKGRMALTYYQEYLPETYFANLDAWIDDFSWYQRHTIEKQNEKLSKKSGNKKTIWVGIPPSPFAIGQAVYGKALSDTLKKQLYARLLPVISGGKSIQIPYDLVQKSFQIACNPDGSEHWEWERNIGIACALYKGWRARHHISSQRRTYTMALDKTIKSRDYLYGRLLATAENIESYALYLAGEKRSTTAERYMQRFAERPFSTWRNIELALRPYQERLRNNDKDTGSQAISKIMELFNPADFTCDDKLTGEFLLGYHSQKMEITSKISEYSKTKTEKNEKTD
ncbi:type I-C CRISPR-associated protein Cas8c/Csd1 [Mannheimia massilioguelmaensis]|uniref:type I-C CRISPR-associated protein Cas8c/Csd1 n=1 Tax=Mannheimia massilioguelmaensis TaxID=1604354 RepID=UPI0005C8C43C|nr:type I-C CRISPR-associated protein Cas8c/Csd1 [Mannheimia massilioguelmaensis]